MADDRIFDLTNEPNPDETVSIIIDSALFPEARETTKAQFMAVDRAAYAAADTAIEDGAGLNADGTLSPEPTSNYLKNADYLAAGYNVDLRNSTLLLDAAIAALVTNAEQVVQIDLTTLEILALAAPITKIAAPGAGLQFHWFECDAFLDFNTTAYVAAAGNGIDVQFVGAGDQIVRLPKAFLEAAAGALCDAVMTALPLRPAVRRASRRPAGPPGAAA